jgi:ATP-dependent Clp protease protease subunit
LNLDVGAGDGAAALSRKRDPDKDIHMYINSPGGVVTDGLAILRHNAVHKARRLHLLHGTGGQHGQRAACKRSQRQALRPAERPYYDAPAGGGFQGQATDMEIQTREMLKTKQRLTEILAEHTGQDFQRLALDIERDFYLSAEEAATYGVVDGVLQRRPAPAKASK